MEKVDKRKLIEKLELILFAGLILFICVNTAEAKKLYGYVVALLNPFIYGFCIAYVLNLFINMFDAAFCKIAKKRNKPMNKKKYRIASIILSIAIVILFVGLSIGLVIPNLKDTVINLYKQAPAAWDDFLNMVDRLKVKQPKLAPYITTIEENISGYIDKLINSLKSNIHNIAGTALTKVKSASNILFNSFAGILIALALLVKKEELIKEFYVILDRLLPKKHFRRCKYVLQLTNEKFQIFLKYNFIQAIITGAGTLIYMLVCNMPYKFSISLLVTVSQLVPIVGAIVGTLVGAILIVTISPVKAVIFVVLSIIVQQIVEKIINPLFMGKELELPGIITFLAIILGGKQLGLFGLICAVPIMSVVYDIYRLKLRPRIYKKEKTADKTE